MDKVIVGLSGGVDSAVSALLLKQQGYNVEAMFMKNWNEDDGSEYCTAKQDLEDAFRIADTLGIELHTVNFAKAYWDNVFDHFLKEYNAGRTPNPDVLCNREIKFKVFSDYARELGADKIATGHYAQTIVDEHGTWLAKGLDGNKDQSYFLNAVQQSELQQTLFPLGEIDKTEVRNIAADNELHNSEKKDSTGICFIGERRFKDFLEQYLKPNLGEIVNENGTVIGQHQGLMFHTIGQRQGLGIGGLKHANDEPWYVAEKILDRNQLLVVQGNQHPLLFKSQLTATDTHWITQKPCFPFACAAKTRYRQQDQKCVVDQLDNGDLTVEFDQPQRAITPGQYVVFYDDRKCLGGAVITG